MCVEEGWAEQLADPSHSEHGSPVVILIASSAIGANNLAKQLPALNKVGPCLNWVLNMKSLPSACWMVVQPIEGTPCVHQKLLLKRVAGECRSSTPLVAEGGEEQHTCST